jgi:uroporphyrinogen-III decarboxylase
MAMEEPMLDKLLEVIIEYNSVATKKLLDMGCDFMGLAEDLGTQNSLPIGLEMWRRYVKPGYEATAGQARDRGVPVFLHSDGYILPLIDDLYETGVRLINPQVRPNKLEGLQKHVRGKMAICLDLDRQLFPFASPQELAEHIQEAHDALSLPEGGLMLSVEIGEDIPLENIDAIFSAREEACGLPCPEDTGGVSVGF